MAAHRGEHRDGGTARVGRGEGRRGSALGRPGDGCPGRSDGIAAPEGRDGPDGRDRSRTGRLPWQRPDGGRGQRHRAGLPHPVRPGLPRRPGQPARRAGQRRGPALRRPPAGPLQVRRHRLLRRACRGVGGRLHRRCPGRRDHPLARRAGRSGARPAGRRPPGPGVLPAHDSVRPGHRPGVAGLDPARLPAVPLPGRPSAGTGQHPDEPARGPARDPQPDRHDQRRRRNGVRARMDPVFRRRRRADHDRHLHHLHPRGVRVCQRRVPGAGGKLHRDAAPRDTPRRRPPADQPRPRADMPATTSPTSTPLPTS